MCAAGQLNPHRLFAPPAGPRQLQRRQQAAAALALHVWQHRLLRLRKRLQRVGAGRAAARTAGFVKSHPSGCLPGLECKHTKPSRAGIPSAAPPRTSPPRNQVLSGTPAPPPSLSTTVRISQFWCVVVVGRAKGRGDTFKRQASGREGRPAGRVGVLTVPACQQQRSRPPPRTSYHRCRFSRTGLANSCSWRGWGGGGVKACAELPRYPRLLPHAPPAPCRAHVAEAGQGEPEEGGVRDDGDVGFGALHEPVEELKAAHHHRRLALNLACLP